MDAREAMTIAALRGRVQGLEAEVARLQEEATADPLTGLLNRRGFDATLGRVLQAAKRRNVSLAVLLLDLDHFKAVNDKHGHAVGDRVLRAVARAISRNLRATDFAARWGGEEFVLVTENRLEGAVRLAGRLREAIETLELVETQDGTDVGPTVSIGVAAVQDPGHCDPRYSFANALGRADAAMYAAKDAGRNTVRVG